MKEGIVIKNTYKVFIALLVVFASLTSIISASAVQTFNNDYSVNKNASVSTSSLNSTYNSMVSKVNSAVNSAQTKISQLYDLDKELIDNYISQAKNELKEMENLKNRI